MVHFTPLSPGSEHTATVRALSSLTARDAAAVRAAIRAAGNRYSVEQHDDYDGYLSLLLTSLHGRESGFLVSGRAGAIDVAALNGDEMVKLGCFPSIGAAMLSLRPALQRDSPATSAGQDAQRLLDRHGSDADLHAAMRADADANADGGDRWRAVIRAIDLRDDLS